MRSSVQKKPLTVRKDSSLINNLRKSNLNEGQTEQSNVPPIVNDVIFSAGKPLEDSTKSYFESRFGHDFGKVRVHTGGKAAQSALSIGAQAYTVRPHVVFGPDYYAPEGNSGRRLLAHELTHVVQQGYKAPSLPLKLSGNNDAEIHADMASERVTHKEASSKLPKTATSAIVSPGTIQRSLLSGILGGIGGALGGALSGGVVGGPIGALVGGAIGLVAGALIGNDATTKSRPLNQTEILYAKDVFKDSIEYSKITITRDSMLAAGAPRTIANTIHLKSAWSHFKGDTLELSTRGIETLIHEMGHVWQYQNGGLAYIPESLWAQLKAKLSGKSRNAAYDWKAAHKDKIPWEEWNPEQQAAAIEDYNKLLRKSKDGTASIPDIAELTILKTYMKNVWERKGAPTYLTPSMEGLPI